MNRIIIFVKRTIPGAKSGLNHSLVTPVSSARMVIAYQPVPRAPILVPKAQNALITTHIKRAKIRIRMGAKNGLLQNHAPPTTLVKMAPASKINPSVPVSALLKMQNAVTEKI